MKVMIIDDSGVMRRIHVNLLTEHQVEDADIFQAEDGAKAFEIAQKENIDLFLVDWNMPKVDGLELVKKLRFMDNYKETPIIELYQRLFFITRVLLLKKYGRKMILYKEDIMIKI